MGQLESRLRKLETHLGDVSPVRCQVCRGYPDIQLVHHDVEAGDGYIDPETGETAVLRWPCPECGYRPEPVSLIVVEYTSENGGNYDAV